MQILSQLARVRGKKKNIFPIPPKKEGMAYAFCKISDHRAAPLPF